LHEVLLAVQSMDNLFSKTPRPTVFQWLCPGGFWLTTFLHVVLTIRMSGAVTPFPIRQADYITFHSEESYDMRANAYCSALGLLEIKAFGKRSSALTPKKAKSLAFLPPCTRFCAGAVCLYLPRSWRTSVFSRLDRKSACKQRSDLEGAP